MSPFPKVSIILPTYNRMHYIGEAIESVCSQSYRDWELIIVDDGSDDETEKIVMELADPRIQFIKAGRIGLNGKIKNIGIKRSNGELIAFIDSDDCWAPGKLEKQVSGMQKYPGAGFSLTGGYDFRERGKPISYFYKMKEGERFDNIFLSLFRSEAAATMPALMVRRSCLATTGLFEETRPFSDVDFLLSLAYHFQALILYEPLFYRRVHDNNYSSANWIDNYKEGVRTIHRYRDNKLLPRPIARESLFRTHINFGEDYIRKGSERKAVEQFFEAWKNRPLSIIPLKKTGKAILHYFRKNDSAKNKLNAGIIQ